MMRIYRALLAWCPPSLRDEYGAAMEETCAARLAEARRDGHRASGACLVA